MVANRCTASAAKQVEQFHQGIVIMGNPVGLLDIIVALSRVQSEIRMLERFPEQYRPDGHLTHIVNATASLQEHVHAWMRTSNMENDRRQAERRNDERRHYDRRHDVPVPTG